VLVSLAVMASACSSYPPLSPSLLSYPPGVTVTDTERTIELRSAITPHDAAGLIFYPGGLVEPEAYVPLLAPIADAGFPVIIARMPLGLASTAPNRAGELLDVELAAEKATRLWVLAGHSVGGSAAARFISRQAYSYPTVRGLVLLGAYPSAGDSLANSGYPVLSIWASEDGLANADDRASTRSLLPSHAQIAIIDGGNHSGFGEYGPQNGDGERRIPLGDQHAQVQELIIRFLDDMGCRSDCRAPDGLIN
jgi:pimeloyl-ACP methyl ester carboxylesterase